MGLSRVAVGGPTAAGSEPTVATEEDLMEAFYAGNDEALEDLMGRYRWLPGSVFGRLPPALGDRADKAQEIVQTAWVKVVDTRTHGKNRWVMDRGPVRPWLWVVVSNCVRDEVRRSGLPDLGLDELTPTVDRLQSEVFHRCELHVIVNACLQSLPWRQQAVLNLKYWVGMNQSEIASVLELSEATVSRAVDGALASLRPMLLAALADEDGGRAQ